MNEYTIMVANNLNSYNLDLSFFKLPNIINNRQLLTSSTIRAVKSNESGGNTFYKISDNPDNAFDVIEINYEGYNGLIIPKFKEITYATHHEHYNFAIDFGTSNSHVAYCSDNDPVIKPFDIDSDNMQMIMLSEKAEGMANLNDSFLYGTGRLLDLEILKNRNFVPNIIGDKAKTKYPIRTVTCESMSFATSDIDLFGNINIGYNFDSEENRLSNTIYYTNIKWGIEDRPDGVNESNRVEAFFIQTLWMIKNKILMSNGTLDPNITWFVPISMKQNTIGTFRTLWERGINKVFGDNNLVNLSMETESTAPYYFLQSHLGWFKGQDAINIDIGGGTVDILFYAKTMDRYYSTSFKFGANTIWGDGITHHQNAASPKDNGFLV